MIQEHQVQIRVRYDEVDPMGFVHHANYLRYFEIGRTEMLRAAGGCYREMEAAGQLVVVVHVDCRYRVPARYDELITVHTRVARVTAAKIIHRYEIRSAEQLLVEAEVTLAVIDRQGRLQRVPEPLLKAYQAEP